MQNWNLKDFSSLACWREEGEFINEIDIEIFFDISDCATLTCERKT
jgi:hypothetical protein